MIRVLSHFRIAKGPDDIYFLADAFEERSFQLSQLFFNLFLFMKESERSLDEIMTQGEFLRIPKSRINEFLRFLSDASFIQSDTPLQF
ncbi:MAG: hypothetical protein LBQ68_10285 [Clostridiales bacterium]|jgi:hypothetical protein|nr:hypothetical protein [Clostridiales bacterium]